MLIRAGTNCFMSMESRCFISRERCGFATKNLTAVIICCHYVTAAPCFFFLFFLIKLVRIFSQIRCDFVALLYFLSFCRPGCDLLSLLYRSVHRICSREVECGLYNKYFAKEIT